MLSASHLRNCTTLTRVYRKPVSRLKQWVDRLQEHISHCFLYSCCVNRSSVPPTKQGWQPHLRSRSKTDVQTAVLFKDIKVRLDVCRCQIGGACHMSCMHHHSAVTLPCRCRLYSTTLAEARCTRRFVTRICSASLINTCVICTTYQTILPLSFTELHASMRLVRSQTDIC